MKPVSRGIDRVAVTFDEPNLVANAGLVLVATLAGRLGLERLCRRHDQAVRDVSAAFRPGRKVLTLGARHGGRRLSHIDHADMLRVGSDRRRCSSTGSWHRRRSGPSCARFTFGHVRQLESGASARRSAPGLGARGGSGRARTPGRRSSTRPSDEVHGKNKHGAAYGYTKKLGYHPILATWAATGEMLHARLRKGSANTQRGIGRFVEELVATRAPGRRDRTSSSCALTRVLVQPDHRYPRAPGRRLHHGRVTAATRNSP